MKKDGLTNKEWKILDKTLDELYPKKKSSHQALLNNCIDDDEAILHKREIEEGSEGVNGC